MRWWLWLSLAGQAFGALGALCTVLYPFESLKNAVGEIREGAPHRDFPDGPSRWWQALRQPPQLKAGLGLIMVGFALQFIGTLVGLVRH